MLLPLNSDFSKLRLVASSPRDYYFLLLDVIRHTASCNYRQGASAKQRKSDAKLFMCKGL